MGFGLLWAIQLGGSYYLDHPEALPVWVESVYPGLAAKFQKMGRDTFAGFLSQLKWRWLAMTVLAFYMFRFSNYQTQSQVDEQRSKWLLRILIVIPLFYLPDFYNELSLRYEWGLFYKPIHFWGIIVPVFPSQWIIVLLISCIGVCSAFLLWALSQNRLSRLGLIALPVPLAWMVLLAAFFGFSKIDHTYSTMYLGTCMLPVLAYSLRKPESFAFAVRILQACVWGSYFFAALEKVFLSGANWISPIHFQQLAYLHPTTLNAWMLEMPMLGSFILISGIVFQLLTVLQWRFAFWGYLNMGGAIMFHLGNWLIFNIGGWQTPWLPMVIFLWPGWLKPVQK